MFCTNLKTISANNFCTLEHLAVIVWVNLIRFTKIARLRTEVMILDQTVYDYSLTGKIILPAVIADGIPRVIREVGKLGHHPQFLVLL